MLTEDEASRSENENERTGHDHVASVHCDLRMKNAALCLFSDSPVAAEAGFQSVMERWSAQLSAPAALSGA